VTASGFLFGSYYVIRCLMRSLPHTVERSFEQTVNESASFRMLFAIRPGSPSPSPLKLAEASVPSQRSADKSDETSPRLSAFLGSVTTGNMRIAESVKLGA
jgi:hypothetical protein